MTNINNTLKDIYYIDSIKKIMLCDKFMIVISVTRFYIVCNICYLDSV